MTRRNSLLMLAAVTVAALCGQTALAQTGVNGRNVAVVIYSQANGTSGSFVQTGRGTWMERNQDGRFDFRELGRDAWSVYLEKTGRQAGQRVQLDLYRKTISTGNHVFYRILSAQAAAPAPGPRPSPRPQPNPTPGSIPSNVNGHNAAVVIYSQANGASGSFIQTGAGTWIERNQDGRFDFRELGRDAWSVYLVKTGRQAGQRVQLDLYRKTVSTGNHVFYRILSAQAATPRR